MNETNFCADCRKQFLSGAHRYGAGDRTYHEKCGPTPMTDTPSLSERLRERIRVFDLASVHHEFVRYTKGDDRLDAECATALDAKDAEIARLQGEVAGLHAVVAAARKMPRVTPDPGGASTEHSFKIEAHVVWALDRALIELDRAASLPAPATAEGEVVKRCAQIAKDRWRFWREHLAKDLDGMDACGDIAAAIRSSSPATGEG